MSDEVWVVTRPKSASWDLMGVFSTEQKAVAACTSEIDFIWPMKIDEKAPEETVVHERGYRPLGVNRV